MTRNISYITYYIASAALMMLLAACSTTSHLPEGETLYTGIGVVSYVDQGGKDRNGIRNTAKGGVIVALADAAEQVKNAFSGKQKTKASTAEEGAQPSQVEAETTETDALALEPVEEEIEAVIAYPPNNSFFGSSRIRTPLPLGLLAYNAWGYKENSKGLGRWLFQKIGSQPVLISSVNRHPHQGG